MGLYVESEKFDALDIIDLLASESAVPVMAHPLLKFTEVELEELLPKAKQHGLLGMECIYPLYGDEKTAIAKRLAEKHGLLQSGGSDYHGLNKEGTFLGVGKNNISVPFELFLKLKDKSTAV